MDTAFCGVLAFGLPGRERVGGASWDCE
jgi:hypothetical protein